MRAIRLTLPLAALAWATSPAIAQDAASGAEEAAPPETSEVVTTLRDPQLQGTLTATAAILGEVLLGMPVGPLVQALDQAVERMADQTGTATPQRAAVAPDATLRDMLGPKADSVSTQLAARVPQAMDAAADMAGAVEKIGPAMAELAERMKRALPARLPRLRRD